MRGTLLLLFSACLACVARLGPEARSHSLAPSTGPERECAWYGDSRDGTLYYGVAAFWSAMRAAGGDPRADLEHSAPQRIGRFDLRRGRLLEPLVLGGPELPSGVWDVLAHPDGPIYFTSLFGLSGRLDPASGALERFSAAGPGLSELELGAGDDLLASRYAGPAGGSVVVLDPAGAVRAEYSLTAPEGYTVAAKSLARDPLSNEIWVNTDLLPLEPGSPVAHDVRVLGPDGVERLRFAKPEVQFMAFAPDGTGYFAEVDGRLLTLRVRPPGGSRAGARGSPAELLTGTLVPLDDAFDAGHDFVQDLKPAQDGSSVVVTRWSGRIHQVDSDGEVRTLRLPRGDGALYYTAVAGKGGVCATRCDGIEVVCQGWEP